MLPIPFTNPDMDWDSYRREFGREHSGVDFPANGGSTIRASGPATVKFAGWYSDNAGYAVVLDYGPELPDVLYCHMNGEPPVRAGQVIGLSHVIGHVGTTGRSTGNHLHMEIVAGVGAHTWHGVWNYFDHNSVVGERTAASNNRERETPMILRVSGKAGKRNNGWWLFANGKATWLGTNPKLAGTFGYVQDDAASAALAANFAGFPN